MKFFVYCIFSFLTIYSNLKASEYVHYPSLTRFGDLKENTNYKILTSETNMVIKQDGHYYNVIMLEHPTWCPGCREINELYLDL